MTAVAVILFLLLVGAGIAGFVLVKRLFQYDGLLQTISEGLDDYRNFLKRKTSRGILEDHPEIREFHERTVELIATIDTWAVVWSRGLDPKKKSVAELMSQDPGRE